ncbi:MAG TPA: carbohydrate ABC transporter permease [Microbacteriaceae bacterium]
MTVLGIIFLAVMIFPVYWMINSSLQANSGAANTAWFPFHPTFAGYDAAIQQQWPNLVTSLIISVSAVALTLLVATPAAYGLARFKMKGMTAFVFVLLITQMIPTIVIANALYTLFNNWGLLNSYLGLILADSAAQIPFAIILMRAFMASIPQSLVEAALVDGANNFRAFVSIVVPISKNAIVTAALFTFLGAWGDFLFALTLTSTPAVRPITLGIYNYLGANVQQWGPVMATAVIASIPAGILLILAQKYIAAGALGGAIK